MGNGWNIDATSANALVNATKLEVLWGCHLQVESARGESGDEGRKHDFLRPDVFTALVFLQHHMHHLYREDCKNTIKPTLFQCLQVEDKCVKLVPRVAVHHKRKINFIPILPKKPNNIILDLIQFIRRQGLLPFYSSMPKLQM